jgi:Zn-dependent membrane protease YugP
MNWVDFIVISVLILILLAIIFFSFILPKIKGIPVECSSCPASKHAKKYLKKYRKLKKKELKNK